MANHYLDPKTDVRREAPEFATSESGRPAHLLEKDIRVVWALRTLFGAPIGASLVFKCLVLQGNTDAAPKSHSEHTQPERRPL